MASDDVVGSASLVLTLDGEDAALADARRLGDRIERVLDRASRDAGLRMTRNISRAIARITPVRVRVEADLRAFGHSIDTLANFPAVSIPVTPDVDSATFQAQVQAIVDGMEVSIKVVPDMDGFDAALRAHNTPTIHVDVDAGGGGLGSIGGQADSATGAVGRLSGALRGLGAVGSLGGILNDIRNLSGAAAALPAVISAGVVALGTFKLATAGVGEALSGALTLSTEQFTKSLEGLTPALQTAASEVRSLKPRFDDLKATLQGAFLAPVAGQFTALAAAMAPLKARAAELSGAFGTVFRELLRGAGSPVFIDSLRSSFDAVTPAVTSLSRVVQPLVGIFSQMAKAVTDAFGGELPGLIDGVAKRLSDFANSGSAGEKAVGWVSGAAVVFKSLAEVASNVAGIFGGLFSAADAAGAESFTGILGTLLGTLNEFVNSAPVQTALGNLFKAFDSILPVVGALASAVGSVLGPALAALTSAALPVVQALAGVLLPVLPVIAGAFTTVVTALTPLINLIGTTLVQVVDAVAPLIGTLAAVFASIATALAPLIVQITGALVPVFAQLAPLIGTLVAALVPLVNALVAALLPVLPPIVEALLAIFNAVVPLIPPLVSLTATVLGFATTIITALAPVLQFVAGVVSWTAINVVTPIIQTVVNVVATIADVLSTVIGAVSSFVPKVVAFFKSLGSTVASTVSSMVSAVVGFFAGLPGKALSAVSSIVSLLTGVFNKATSAVVTAVTNLVSDAVNLVKELPGKAASALAGIGSLLVSAGADMMRGFINGIKSMAGEIASAALGPVKSAVDGVKGFLHIGSPSKLMRQIGAWTGEGLIIGLTSQEAGIKAASEKLVSQITDAFRGRNVKIDDVLVAQIQRNEKTLLALAKRREGIAEQIKKANEFALQTAQSAAQGGALQGLNLDDGVKGVTFGIKQATQRIRRFNAEVQSLAKRGVSKSILSQLIGLGPDQGAGLAKTLSAATGQQLADLNNAQKQLEASAKQFGQTSADVLFDSGAQASKGFLAGLKAQQNDLTRFMTDLARKLAQTVRKELGIHSPSRVFAGIGVDTMRGLDSGMQSQLATVRRTAAGALDGVVPSLGAASASRFTPGSQSRQTGAGDRGGVTNVGGARNITQNITLTSVDSKSTADRIMARLASAAGSL